MRRERQEGAVRDHLMDLLFDRIGQPETMMGTGGSARFSIRPSLGGGVCVAEGALSYHLPDGLLLSHKNDILVSLPGGKQVALEIKFLSAVTDQFKTRAYDALHLKRTHGEEVVSVMVYLHVPGHGISIERARAICYPFDKFIGLEANDDPIRHEVWSAVTSAVEAEVAGAHGSRPV